MNAVREALAELVACKDLKDAEKAAREKHYGSGITDDYREAKRLREEYERRQPLAWEAARAALSAPPAGAPTDKRAPVQGYSAGIPWSMHLEAYDAYRKKHGKQEALIEGWCRGGFSTGELDEYIPGWRDRVSEIGRLKAEVEQLRAALSAQAPTWAVPDARYDALISDLVALSLKFPSASEERSICLRLFSAFDSLHRLSAQAPPAPDRWEDYRRRNLGALATRGEVILAKHAWDAALAGTLQAAIRAALAGGEK